MKSAPVAVHRGRFTMPVRLLGAAIGVAVALGAVAAPFEPYVLRIAVQGPGRTAIIELDHFETKRSCVVARDAFLAHAHEVTTPDGLRWTVLGARCAVPGTAA